jgi:cell division protein FtsB
MRRQLGYGVVFAIGVVVVTVAVGVVGAYVSLTHRMRQLQRRCDQEQAAARQFETKTGDLRGRQERFLREPAFVERVAREHGLVKTNEVVFKFDAAAPVQSPPR